jgi:hypothetical protein
LGVAYGSPQESSRPASIVVADFCEGGRDFFYVFGLFGGEVGRVAGVLDEIKSAVPMATFCPFSFDELPMSSARSVVSLVSCSVDDDVFAHGEDSSSGGFLSLRYCCTILRPTASGRRRLWRPSAANAVSLTVLGAWSYSGDSSSSKVEDLRRR